MDVGGWYVVGEGQGSPTDQISSVKRQPYSASGSGSVVLLFSLLLFSSGQDMKQTD